VGAGPRDGGPLYAGSGAHAVGVDALRRKYDQYAEHDLESRPIIRISPDTVRSWGRLERPDETP
jgi:hypothetical protein